MLKHNYFVKSPQITYFVGRVRNHFDNGDSQIAPDAETDEEPYGTENCYGVPLGHVPAAGTVGLHVLGQSVGALFGMLHAWVLQPAAVVFLVQLVLLDKALLVFLFLKFTATRRK